MNFLLYGESTFNIFLRKERNMKERYGVVDPEERYEYETKWQLPFMYDFISFDENEAIRYCRKNFGTVVEKIMDNGREIIFENKTDEKDFTVSEETE